MRLSKLFFLRKSQKEKIDKYANEEAKILVNASFHGSKLVVGEFVSDLYEISEEEFKEKYDFQIAKEFAIFSIHICSRITFNKLEKNTRNMFLDSLGLKVATHLIFGYYGVEGEDNSYKENEKRISKFYKEINEREQEYGSCQIMLVKQENDYDISERNNGVKSKGAINLLADNVEIILVGKIIGNPVINLTISEAKMSEYKGTEKLLRALFNIGK